MRRFALFSTFNASTGLSHVAPPKKHHAPNGFHRHRAGCGFRAGHGD
jgi:hypothetical protein